MSRGQAHQMSVTEEIKSRLDIVNFISQYVQLKKAGRNYTARCPFHNEKTPSFVVFPESQNWRCFGACGEGGDIFNFMMKREGLDFTAALQLLAEKAGVELQQRTTEQVSQDEYLDKLRGLLQETARFFHNKLWETGTGDGALAYAHRRGLTDETLVNFTVGYAPDDWQQTIDHLTTLGYSQDDIIETGIAIRNDRGRVYDRFRNRLMIPIHDARGLVIGFGARALNPDDNPKYLNSPQTILFDKSAVLFGLHNARRAIRESETAVIVEGYMDAIQAHQAGFTNVVAQMGTALTDPQLKQLSKYARRLILALDPDAAGTKATMRGLDVARQSSSASQVDIDLVKLAKLGKQRVEKDKHETSTTLKKMNTISGVMPQASKLDIELFVVSLPENQDPDDLIRDDPGAWRNLIDAAIPVADYVISTGTAHLTSKSTFGEREQVAHELLPILVATENDRERHYNIQRLALQLHLDERSLLEWTQQQKRNRHIEELSRQRKQKEQALQNPQVAIAKQLLSQGKTNEQSKHVLGLSYATESYCLAILIRESRLLATANRKFRELAAQTPQTRESLGQLTTDDWLRTDYRAIFSTLQRALGQDDLEPIEYLQQNLPYELSAELDRLLTDPLDIFKQNLHPSMHAQFEVEVEATRKKKEWTSAGNEETEFIQRILDLRKQSLRRNNQELFFLIQEADPDSQLNYNHRLRGNSQAIKVIDEAVKAMAQLQRAH
jgi:DNA primase